MHTENVQILDGKVTSTVLRERILTATSKLAQEGIFPKLDIILVGNNKASWTYIRTKRSVAEKLGIRTELHQLPDNASFDDVLERIYKCNIDPEVSGIIIQLPLPEHLKAYEDKIIEAIDPEKDADCFVAENIGKVFLDTNLIIPCTAHAVLQLLDYYHIDVRGKKIAIVGASNLVGKPLALELINREATVLSCNIFTKNLAQTTSKADIVVSAAGVAGLITPEHVRKGAVVIDVGSNYIVNPDLDDIILGKFDVIKNFAANESEVEEGRTKLIRALIQTDPRFKDLSFIEASRLFSKYTSPTAYVGDVMYSLVKDKCSAISPVPGGVGPNTVANLLQNTVMLCLYQNVKDPAEYGLKNPKGMDKTQQKRVRRSSANA